MTNFNFICSENSFVSAADDVSEFPESWCHFERNEDNKEQIKALGISTNDSESLLDETTRPHFHLVGENSFLLFLRTINLNPDSVPEDMVSLRFWFNGKKLVTITHRNVQALHFVKEQLLTKSDSIYSTPALFIELINQVMTRLERHVIKLSNKMEQLEDEQSFNQSDLHDLRRSTSRLQRFMLPQLEALKKLALSDLGWLDKKLKHSLKEFVGSMNYYNEEIALIKERCEILSYEINSKLTERVNRNLYIISIITVIFLPLSFITGLLGINVGGIPGSASASGFLAVALIIFALLVVQLLILKFYKWF